MVALFMNKQKELRGHKYQTPVLAKIVACKLFMVYLQLHHMQLYPTHNTAYKKTN